MTEARSNSTLWRRLAGVALVAALLSGCSVNPATGRSQLILLSSSQVAAMGESAKPELIQTYGGEVPYGSVRQYVEQVGRSMVVHTEATNPSLPWEFFVLDSDVINAFALPGGKVFVSRGLLVRLPDEAAMAGVIGHEIGHVTAKHVDERLSKATAAQLGVAVLAGTTDSQLAVMAADAFSQGYLLKFGRDQELEADRLGLRYMSRAGYNPESMVEVMNVLIAASQGSTVPEFFSTHPDPKKRLIQIENLMAGEYAHTASNPNYGRFEQRFHNEVLDPMAGGVRQVHPGTGAGGFCAVCRAHPVASPIR